MRDGDEVLRVKCAGFQEAYGNRRLETRPSNTGGVWDERGERPIFVIGGNTEDKGGTNLCSHAEIDEPDLAALRRNQRDCSRRSSS